MIHGLKAGAVAAAMLVSTSVATAQTGTTVDYKAVASRVVTESAGVKPGEVVLISGSPAELELLKELETAVLVAGGQPILTIDFPEARKAALMTAPIEYLRQPPKSELAMLALADVMITASAVQDPTLFADVDEARLNLRREASAPIDEALRTKRGRSVDIGQLGGIPTEAYARNQGADYAAMRAMFFRALAVPSATVAQRGAGVVAKMQPGRPVRVRTPAGTDLTFRLASGKPRVSSGKAADNDTGTGMASTFLPAGDFYACVDPASANGTVVSPTDFFRGRKLRNVRMTFKDGAVTGVTADGEAAALTAYFAQLDQPSKHLSLLNIGLNPESRPLPGSDYLSWEMSGVSSLVLGNTGWAGCAQGGEGGYTLRQSGATLTSGGTEVIRTGQLVD